MESGNPEVPELPGGWEGNSAAPLSLGDINTESWSSRIGVGHETDNLILYKDNC